MTTFATRQASGRSQGFSLVELLIAMTLGLVLISGMIAVFQGNRQSTELNSAMANLQENARFAMDRMAVDIRSAGFQGCLDIGRGPAVVSATNTPTTDFNDTAVIGYDVAGDGSWSPSRPAGFTGTVKPGTHVLSLMFGGQDTFLLKKSLQDTSGISSAAGDVVVDIRNDTNTRTLTGLGLDVGDLAIVSDCGAADIFAISSITTADDSYTLGHAIDKNTTASFSKAYGLSSLPEVRFMSFSANLYYVADTGSDNEKGESIYALYRQSYPYDDANNPPVELVQGVENLRVSFGVRKNSNDLQYMDIDDTALDRSKIESVRVGMLMTSEQSIAQVEDGSSYMLAGQAISAARPNANAVGENEHARDHRFRLAFNTTVKVRNRRR